MADSNPERSKNELGKLDNFQEKKIRFVEHLITLGGLLAVFLGFNLQSNAINQPLILMGTTFAVTALVTYSYFMFLDQSRNSLPATIFRSLLYSLLSGSFSGIVLLAYTYAFTGAGAGDILRSAIIFGLISVVFFAIYFFVGRILRMEETSKRLKCKVPFETIRP